MTTGTRRNSLSAHLSWVWFMERIRTSDMCAKK